MRYVRVVEADTTEELERRIADAFSRGNGERLVSAEHRVTTWKVDNEQEGRYQRLLFTALVVLEDGR